MPLLSKFLISLNSLALALLGFSLVRGNLAEFPTALALIFMVGFTLAINFIDLKDFKADKKAGIKTLPVMLGQRNAKIATGLFFAGTYLSFVYIVRETWAMPLLLGLAIVQFWLMNRKNYSEKPVLVVYLLSIIALIAYILLAQA